MPINNKDDCNFITVECLLEFDKDEDKEGVEGKELKKMLSQKYGVNTRYSDDAIFLAQQSLDFCVERREKLRQKWEERRYGILYSREDKAKEEWHLRINEVIGIDINAYPFHEDKLKWTIRWGRRQKGVFGLVDCTSGSGDCQEGKKGNSSGELRKAPKR